MLDVTCANRNLTPVSTPTYSPEPGVELPIQTHKGPVAKEYLDILYRVARQAIDDHRRVLACRFDLALPYDVPLPEDAFTNVPVQRCIDSFKTRVKLDGQRRNSPHNRRVRYVIAREYSEHGRPHFHMMLFLNLHAYHSPGTVDYDQSNLFNMLTGAWASALQLPEEVAKPRVQLCRGRPVEHEAWLAFSPQMPLYSHYYLDSADQYAAFPAMFFRGSYLCKLSSKRYGDGQRAILHSHR
ncbi:YagK/YfjJ domain-containing protein [Vreelandella venusta]|uniref:YagK/YfjJ domain-containing protein n=1 Tax=Vreelandella venusta TaxID=44935 RepID=UPI003C2C6AD0